MSNSYLITAAIISTSFLIPSIVGACRFRLLDRPARIFWGLVLLAFVSDLIAIYYAINPAVNGKGNIKVYNIAGITFTSCVCIYFNSFSREFLKREVGLYLGILSIIFGILNSCFIQSLDTPNTYFRIYQCLAIICMGLTSLGLIVIKPGYVNVRREPHFWLFSALVFFWSFIYLHLLLYDHFKVLFPQYQWIIAYSIFFANIIYNIFVAVVFMLYPKMTKPHGSSQNKL